MLLRRWNFWLWQFFCDNLVNWFYWCTTFTLSHHPTTSRTTTTVLYSVNVNKINTAFSLHFRWHNRDLIACWFNLPLFDFIMWIPRISASGSVKCNFISPLVWPKLFVIIENCKIFPLLPKFLDQSRNLSLEPFWYECKMFDILTNSFPI